MKIKSINRRRFLEYAGATAAVVGGTVLGLDLLPTLQPNPIAKTATSSTSSTVITSSLTLASSAKAQLASLSGRLFFDYNGNGKQEDNEPSIGDAKVQLKNDLGDIVAETATDSAGAFKMEYVPVGSYRLFTVADPRFRYMCRSADECAGIRDGYRISLSEGLTQLNVGLMEGFLTLPFQRNEFRMKSYVDLDPALGVRDWRGGRDTYDGHPGTDFLANEAIDILATAPGTIFAAASGWPDNQNWTSIDYYRNNGNFVIVDHGNGLYIAYHHLKSIAVNETLWSSAGPSISRGQVIGQVGATGVTAAGGTERISVPHLHLQVWNGSGFMHGRVDALDPYRDLHYDKHGPSPWANNASLWSKDNDPQYSVP